MANFFSVAVIGVAHGHAYQMCAGLELEGAKIDYVCENSERERNHFLSIYPQAKSATEADILQNADVDLVLIAGIPAERAEAAVRAMRAGKDVLSAKAPAISLEQLDLLRRTVEETGRRYFVFYSERVASEAALYAEQIIADGVIGKVLNVTILAPHKLGEDRPDWFFKRQSVGGILIDIASHQFEQFLAYTGNRKAEILSASVGNFSHADKKEFEDFADCHLIGENGATGYIRVDWFTPQSFPVFGDGKVVILGTKGTIELRKYIDVGVNGVTETVLLSTEEESRKFSVKGQIEKPFFRNIIKDCLHRTYTASDIERTLYTMELAITAQQKAQKIAEK